MCVCVCVCVCVRALTAGWPSQKDNAPLAEQTAAPWRGNGGQGGSHYAQAPLRAHRLHIPGAIVLRRRWEFAQAELHGVHHAPEINPWREIMIRAIFPRNSITGNFTGVYFPHEGGPFIWRRGGWKAQGKHGNGEGEEDLSVV